MNQQTFDQLLQVLHKYAKDIATAKRPGYTQGNRDVLRNFKRVADAIPNECPECGHGFTLNAGQVWAVYFLKHVDATVSGAARPNLPQAEALDGRFADILNYTDLGFGIVVEQEIARKQREASERKFVPESEPLPHPGPAPQTESQPMQLKLPFENEKETDNVLPWKSREDRISPPSMVDFNGETSP